VARFCIIYSICVTFVARFCIIYSIFIMGFSQAYFIIFRSYSVPEENPLETSVESTLQVILNHQCVQ
jgi:hypothetical protein